MSNEELTKRVMELTRRLDEMIDASKMTLAQENTLIARGFAKTSPIPTISGTVWVASSSGGTTTQSITFTNGVRTA